MFTSWFNNFYQFPLWQMDCELLPNSIWCHWKEWQYSFLCKQLKSLLMTKLSLIPDISGYNRNLKYYVILFTCNFSDFNTQACGFKLLNEHLHKIGILLKLLPIHYNIHANSLENSVFIKLKTGGRGVSLSSSLQST